VSGDGPHVSAHESYVWRWLDWGRRTFKVWLEIQISNFIAGFWRHRESCRCRSPQPVSGSRLFRCWFKGWPPPNSVPMCRSGTLRSRNAAVLSSHCGLSSFLPYVSTITHLHELNRRFSRLYVSNSWDIRDETCEDRRCYWLEYIHKRSNSSAPCPAVRAQPSQNIAARRAPIIIQIWSWRSRLQSWGYNGTEFAHRPPRQNGLPGCVKLQLQGKW